jgi:hypothetical protein
MARIVRIAVLATLAIIAFPTPSTAACTVASGNGIWDLYTLANAGWFRCSVRILNGSTSGYCIHYTGSSTRISGRISISSTCRVSGLLVQTLADGRQIGVRLVQSTLGAENSILSGVGTVSDGSLFIVQAVRR